MIGLLALILFGSVNLSFSLRVDIPFYSTTDIVKTFLNKPQLYYETVSAYSARVNRSAR